jgi:metal-dependent amidase/aminoacylase/carboxypeptidase family protein
VVEQFAIMLSMVSCSETNITIWGDILTPPDALPEIGHGCGHSLIAASSLASAIGVSAALKAFNLPGTLILMGTPAEETGGGKWIGVVEATY